MCPSRAPRRRPARAREPRGAGGAALAPAVLAGAALLAAHAPDAAACSPEGPIQMVAPLPGRTEVATTDGILSWWDEPVLTRLDDGSVVALARADEWGHLYFPAAPLLEGAAYAIAGQSGSWTVAGGGDTTPPEFAGATSARFIIECFDEGGLPDCDGNPTSPLGRIQVDYALASDDRAAPEELVYRYDLHLEAKTGVPLRTWFRPGGQPFAASPISTDYAVSYDPITYGFDAGERYCMRVTAVDLSGNASGGDALACGRVERAGCLFGGDAPAGCACRAVASPARPAPGTNPWPALLVAVAGLAAARVSRRRRRETRT